MFGRSLKLERVEEEVAEGSPLLLARAEQKAFRVQPPRNGLADQDLPGLP